MKKSNWILLFALLILFTGCVKEEISLKNIQLLAAIKTGISIESKKQIAACREEIVNEVQQGNIPEDLGQKLNEIIKLAEEGKWKEAESGIVKLQKKYIVDSQTVHDHDHGKHKHKH